VLGDIHNLFGDTHTVNVEHGEQDELLLTELESGDCAHELLASVHINSDQIINRCTSRLEKYGVSEFARREILDEIQNALFGYTYLDSLDRTAHRIKGQKHA